MSSAQDQSIIARLGRGPATRADLHTACAGHHPTAVNEALAELVRAGRVEIVPSGEQGVTLYVMTVPPAAPRKRGKKLTTADLYTPAQLAWREAAARVKKQ